MHKKFKDCSWCIPHVLLMLMLFVSVGFMLGSSMQESAVMDELAHIPAGYGYAHFLDYRLNPEHPPLLKALSAIPLLCMGLQFPTALPSWASDLNGQWDAGRQFLYESNDGRADEIIFMARLFPIVLTILLIVLIYAWSQKLFGPWWALLPALLATFSPHILAHGHYVTTDIAASLGFFLGLFGFIILFGGGEKQISWKRTVYAGLLFGVAQLLKFSLALLIPLYVFFVFALWVTKDRTWKHAWELIRPLLFVFLIGYALVWAVYLLFTWNYPMDKQVSDTVALLNEQTQNGSLVAKTVVAMSGIPILRAIGHYGLGVLMVSQRAAGGNTAYFLGSDGNGGWWYYFPVVFLLKESLPALLILFSGFLLWIGKFFRKNDGESWRAGRIAGNLWRRFVLFVQQHTDLFVMSSFVIFYWLYSMQSPLNIGFRHILPTIPFLYILAVSSLKNRMRWQADEKKGSLGVRTVRILKNGTRYGFLLLLCIWVFAEAAVSYPYFISYFNEISGGVWGGHAYAVDSNYDWGQDLKRLQTYVQERDISKIAVDYFGGGDVRYYIPNAVPWDESKGNPLSENIDWLAVSINELEYDIHATDSAGTVFPHRRYRWIPNPYEPYARAGTSIFIYRLR